MLGAGHHLLLAIFFVCGCQVFGWLSKFWVAGVVCDGGSCMTWHVDNVEGALVVIDASDMDMWLLSLVDEFGC